MELPRSMTTAFAPSRQGLLNVSRTQINDETLWDISRASQGPEIDKRFAVLRSIRDRGIVPSLDSHLRWALTSSCKANFIDFHPPPFNIDPTKARTQWKSVFACAVLLNHGTDWDTTVAMCVSNTRYLGDEINEALASLILAELQSLPDQPRDEFRHWPFSFAFGLLVVACRLRPRRVSDAMIRELINLFQQTESRFAHSNRPVRSEPSAGIANGAWISSTFELREHAKLIPDGELINHLNLLAVVL